MEEQEERREYIIQTAARGIEKISVPASWKVTYGKAQPGTRDSTYSEGGMVLRLYETENKQRACFTGVQNFRDTTIKVYTHRGTDDAGELVWEESKDGKELIAREAMVGLGSEQKSRF